jgi:tRNA(fMet)-specific endonuclease VapC
MVILDTNALSELFKENMRVLAFLDRLSDEEAVTTTTISRFEILKGRYASVLNAADQGELLLAWQRLTKDEAKLAEIDILPVDEAAADHFDRLRGNKKLKRIGRPDLLIACICLAHDATLVTRNVKDFAPAPRLKVENWAS